MSISEVIQNAITWFAWGGLGLAGITLISFITNWGIKFRLTGATIFTLLLSASCWAFEKSYTPPVVIEGYKYAPIVYDNGSDLVVAQAEDNFPQEAIEPTLQQIASNLKGGGRNGVVVTVRLRRLENVASGISKPVILGEVLRDTKSGITIKKTQENLNSNQNLIDESKNETGLNIHDTEKSI